jgi:hypothetical protein
MTAIKAAAKTAANAIKSRAKPAKLNNRLGLTAIRCFEATRYQRRSEAAARADSAPRAAPAAYTIRNITRRLVYKR